MQFQESARVYNLFPRLAGNISGWVSHLDRISEMDFNWIFLNPIQSSGFSGSLYSIADYYRLNSLFFPSQESAIQDLLSFLKEAKKRDIRVMIDLVINHTAIDHAWVKNRSHWYKQKNGKVQNSGTWQNSKWVEWGDLAELSYENFHLELVNYWKDCIFYYLQMGFDGFRCDSAYQIPPGVWETLIRESKKAFPDSQWFAETLGCSSEKTIELANMGFDYTFNSFKWWDYQEEWCLEQYNSQRLFAHSIGFPESHDTPRLYSEKTPQLSMHRYLFASLFSSGVMMPIGFEYGFQKPLHVVQSSPQDYQQEYQNRPVDFSKEIRKIHQLKKAYRIFNEDCEFKKLSEKEPRNNSDEPILWFQKTHENERILLAINPHLESAQKSVSASEYFHQAFPNIKKDGIQQLHLKLHPKNETALELEVFPSFLDLEGGEIQIFYGLLL